MFGEQTFAQLRRGLSERVAVRALAQSLREVPRDVLKDPEHSKPAACAARLEPRGPTAAVVYPVLEGVECNVKGTRPGTQRNHKAFANAEREKASR